MNHNQVLFELRKLHKILDRAFLRLESVEQYVALEHWRKTIGRTYKPRTICTKDVEGTATVKGVDAPLPYCGEVADPPIVGTEDLRVQE